jgi:hypothetical protein
VAARSAGSVTLVDTKTISSTYSTGTTGIPANSLINFTMTQPGYRFRTGAGAAADTTSITAPYVASTLGGVVGIFTDSTHMTIFAPPGFNNRVVLTKLFHPAQSFYNLSLPAADTIKVDSLPQIGLGQDNPDAGAVGLVTLPAMNAGDVYVFWDNATFTAPDSILEIGTSLDAPDQFVEIVITTAGRYRFTVAWDNTADIDNYLVNGTLSGFRATCGNCNTNPEVLTSSATTPLAAGSHQFWAGTIWSGTKPVRLRFIVTRVS